MDRIDSYRVFVRVVECRSFTRAAATLHIPRSTVSTVIQDLEVRLGTCLLHRTTRRVAPSADGSAFYERCLQLIADFDETETLFRQKAARPRGKLRISVPARIARRIIAPALPAFVAEYPEIEVDLSVTDCAVNLVEAGVDCAVRVGPPRDSALIAHRLGELELCNCASPAYLEMHGTPEAVGDLKKHLAVNYVSPASGRVEEWEYVEDGEIRLLLMNSRVTVDNAEAYIACCLAGLGLIQVPAYDVRDYLGSGKLVEVMPGHRAAPMPLAIIYPYRRHLSRRLRAFVRWVTALFQQQILGAPSDAEETV